MTEEPEHTVWPAGAPGTHNPDLRQSPGQAPGASKHLNDTDCHREADDRAEHEHLPDLRMEGATATRLGTADISSGKQSMKEGAVSSAASSEGDLTAELARGAVLDQAQSESRFEAFPFFYCCIS